MLVKYLMSDGMIPMQLDGSTRANVCDFLSMPYYAVLKGNLVSFAHQLASVLQIAIFMFNSMLIEYLMGDEVILTQFDGSTMAKACKLISMQAVQ